MSMTSEPLGPIDRLIDRMGELPASPTVAQKLLQLTRNPDFEIVEIAGCLEQNPALADRIVRVVNSSRFGLVGKVGTLRHAAAHLGQPSLRMFAMTVALVETLTSRSPSSLGQGFWARASFVAATASLLCETHAPEFREEAYLSGLLADVGVLILARWETSRYEPLFDRNAQGEPLLEAEQEEFQFTHPLLGARLLQLWEVPDPVVGAVANHHGIASGGDTLSQVVQAAELLAETIRHPVPDQLFLSALRLHQKFGMDRQDLIRFTETLNRRLVDGEDFEDSGDLWAKGSGEFLVKLREGVEDAESVI